MPSLTVPGTSLVPPIRRLTWSVAGLVYRASIRSCCSRLPAEQGDPVGHGGGFVVVMGDHQDGGVQLLPHLCQQLVHGGAERGVQGAEGFIEQQDRWPCGQRPGDGHTLLLPAGELRRCPFPQTIHLDQFQEDLRVGPGALLGGAADGGGEGHIVQNVQVRKEQGPLEDHGHSALLGADTCQVPAFEQDRSAVRDFKAGGCPQESAFTRAGGPQDRSAGTCLQGQADIIKCGDRGLSVRLGQMVQDQCLGHGRAPFRRPARASNKINGGPSATTDRTATTPSLPVPDAAAATSNGTVTTDPPPTRRVTR